MKAAKGVTGWVQSIQASQLPCSKPWGRFKLLINVLILRQLTESVGRAIPMQHFRLVKVVVKLVCVIAGEAASRLQVQQSPGSMAGQLTVIYGGSCLQPGHPRCLPACHSTI